MIICPKCGAQVAEDSAFCPICGIQIAGQPPIDNHQAPTQNQPPMNNQPPVQPQYPPQYAQPPVQQVVYTITDHTAEFSAEDISANKVTAMAPYLLGVIGIIIALLAGSQSPFASFHSRQALKIELVSVLIGIISLVLCWTFIVPFAGSICYLILLVVKVICFFQVCSGKAKDAPIVGSLPFLK